MNVTLNETTKAAIEKSTGMLFDDIINSDSDTINKHIEQKINKKLTFNINSSKKLLGRGSVLIALKRFLMIDIEKELDRIHQ